MARLSWTSVGVILVSMNGLAGCEAEYEGTEVESLDNPELSQSSVDSLLPPCTAYNLRFLSYFGDPPQVGYFNMENEGPCRTPATTVRARLFTCGGVLMETRYVDVDALRGGGFFTGEPGWLFPPRGRFDYMIDPADNIHETSEGDNFYAGKYHAPNYPPCND